MTPNKEDAYIVYVDTGGTFSDAVIVSPDGSIVTGKADTTPEKLDDAFFNCIEEACRKEGMPAKEILGKTQAIGYGTTIGTNIMVSGVGGPKLGFITTKGEEDRIFITRKRAAGLTRAGGMHPNFPRKL